MALQKRLQTLFMCCASLCLIDHSIAAQTGPALRSGLRRCCASRSTGCTGLPITDLLSPNYRKFSDAFQNHVAAEPRGFSSAAFHLIIFSVLQVRGLGRQVAWLVEAQVISAEPASPQVRMEQSFILSHHHFATTTSGIAVSTTVVDRFQATHDNHVNALSLHAPLSLRMVAVI